MKFDVQYLLEYYISTAMNKKQYLTKLYYGFLLIIFLCAEGFSQDLALGIWDSKVPDAIEHHVTENVEMENGTIRRISMVSNPTIDVFFPEQKNGTAVLICPGGGYSYLSYTHEGIAVAQWMNTLGVTGIVVKSRLPENELMNNKRQDPLMDAQQALRLVRKKAKDWGLEKGKIGVMGFSAGGHLAASASTNFTDSVTRPDFSILVYPVITMDTTFTHMGSRRKLLGEAPDSQLVHKFSAEQNVTADTPPAFLIHSFDDRVVPQENSLAYYQALKENEVKGSELHVFPNGNHGYGMATGKKGNVSLWTTLLKNWMEQQGYLK